MHGLKHVTKNGSTSFCGSIEKMKTAEDYLGKEPVTEAVITVPKLTLMMRNVKQPKDAGRISGLRC